MKISRMDFTKFIPSSFRKADMLARFLELNQTCVSVSVVKNEFLISSNKLPFKKGKSEYQKKSLCDGITILKNYIQNSSNKKFTHEKEIEYEIFARFYLTNIGLMRDVSKIFDKMLILAQNKLDTKAIHESLKILANPSYEGKKYKESFEFILKHKSYIFDLKPIKSHPKFESFKKIYNNLEISFSRLEQDTKKMSSFLKNNSHADLKKAILAFNKQNVILPVSADDKDSHAEMNIVKYVIDNKITNDVYIGISKLSCLGCFGVLDVFLRDGAKPNIYFRGTHAVHYETRKLTEWEEASPEKFFYTGISRHENQELLFAEASDSDNINEASIIGNYVEIVDEFIGRV
jgi:hypothetical protein